MGSLPKGISARNAGFASPHRFKRKSRAVCNTPKPYFTLRWKLMDEASSKYFVGQDNSPMRKPKYMACTTI